MRIHLSFTGILVLGAVSAHLFLTLILFSSILTYVGKSYSIQFVENARTTSSILSNQASYYLENENNELPTFLDDLLLSGSINYIKIILKNGTTYLPGELPNVDIKFQEDFFFSENDDKTYFISIPVHSANSERNGVMYFGFDETLVQNNIDTAYSRGVFFAVGYFILIIILILLFIPKLTSSLSQLKNAARKISSGDTDKEFNISSNIDEFSSLINSLEIMRASLVDNSKEVKKKEMYIRTIMNRMADAMVIMNDDMIIQSLNTAAEDIFGYKSEDIAGKPFDNLLAPCGPGSDCKNCEKLHTKAHTDHSCENTAIECLGRRNTGLTFPVELFYSNFEYEHDRIIICNAHDMTEYKKSEKKLTNALESAEQANKSKSVFLSSMSHELRTPLNAIIGYSEILLEEAEDKKDEASSSDLKKIRNSGKHLLSLINNVLDLSKIEAGKMDIDLQEFLVSQVVEDIEFTTTPLTKKNDNELIINYTDINMTMFSDFTKVKQALINLIGNATKFTEHGIVTLNITTDTINDQEIIQFEVIDTGIGIAEEDMHKLFKEFSQANSQVMTKYGGTGLGLIISQKFCQMLGGNITVKSELGVGSSFTVTLPVRSIPTESYN